MSTYSKKGMLLSILFCLTSAVYARSLTPDHEPKYDLFYVCYQKSRINYSIRAPLLNYHHKQYVGCNIQQTPCCMKTRKKEPIKKVFGQFDTRTDALNAFYRCAYSGSQP